MKGSHSSEKLERLTLQGELINSSEAEKLCHEQKNQITTSLSAGFDTLDRIEVDNEHEGEFPNQIRKIKATLNEVRISETVTPDIVARLVSIYKEIHENEEFDEDQKLFLEFILGIAFVDINIRIGLATVKAMAISDTNSTYFDSDSKKFISSLSIPRFDGAFMEGLKQTSEVAYKLGDKMHEIFGSDPESYWELVADALKKDSELDSLARTVVSMRYIPENRRILGIAQSLHWSGWGGDISILKDIPQLNDELFLRHAISWHAYGKKVTHFSQRMSLFSALISKLKEREAANLGPIIRDSLKEQSELRIFDAGAGPTASGSANWLARSLATDFDQITIDAGEVDGASLKRLAELQGKKILPGLPKNIRIGDVVFLDLAQPWENAPTDKYDIFVTSIVLHQLMDTSIGSANIARVLKAATKSIKNGGYLAWSDAGANAYIQSSIIPFNASDREGCVPENIFAYISYHDVKIHTRTVDGTAYYKIPFRMSNLRSATPDSVVKKYGSGIYESNIFSIVEVPASVVDLLDEAKNNPDECDRIMKDHLKDARTVNDQRTRINNSVVENSSVN